MIFSEIRVNTGYDPLEWPPTEDIPPIVPGPSCDNWTFSCNQSFNKLWPSKIIKGTLNFGRTQTLPILQSCQLFGTFLTRNIFKKFSAYFITNSLKRAILFEISGEQRFGRRQKVGNFAFVVAMRHSFEKLRNMYPKRFYNKRAHYL